ncbi:MAG: sigma-70 family RNA polymerase sigma factor, partial [Planctomycetaceae bacterium]
NAPKTRPSLILRLRDRQDLDAWQQFVEIYQPLVFRLAINKGFQDSDAADIVQEVLLRVAGAVERWDPDERRGTFRGWLYRIARNLMISFLEKNDRQPVVAGYGSLADLLAVVPDSGDLPSSEFDKELDRQVFAWAAGRVESTCQESTWQAFWRTAVDDQPPEVVADQLHLSVGSVYVARCRVIQKLRREVQRFTRDADAGEVSE